VSSPVTSSSGELDVERLRADFPILGRTVHGKRLVYLDSAASTQKPQTVIDTVSRFYSNEYSNVHRGLHQLSAKATDVFEGVREKLQAFINAAESCEIVYTSGSTGAINLVAYSWGDTFVHAGDEIIVTEMEHHANIVPWQLLCERRGATLRVVPINDDGELILEEYEKLLGERTKLVALSHTSNALGTRNPVRRIADAAHAVGAVVLVDAAQAMAHERIDVAELNCDFLCFSAHKMLGPTGIGALYGRREILESMPPFLGGGEMIYTVSFEKTTYKAPPHRFEAGTPDIAGVFGLGAAIDYLNEADLDAIGAYEHELLAYATEQLLGVPGLRIIGTARDKAAIISFCLDDVHPHDLGTVIDMEGVAVRAGHHCAQPVMDRFGVPATVRASFAFYNTRQDVDVLVASVYKAIEVLG